MSLPHPHPSSPRGRNLRTAVVPLAFLLIGASGLAVGRVQADDSVQLTDKIFNGDGVINLLKDMTGAQLMQHIQSTNGLLLGVDLNEDEKGNESHKSVGTALKRVELAIKTTAGDFTFSDFYTNTTAMIREAGASSASQFHTMFGQGGSSQITSATKGFNMGKFDDVLQLRNVTLNGTIKSAELRVKFLDTANTGGANETFFDYSGGFEDFAMLSMTDANSLETAGIGTTDAPGTVTVRSTPTIYTTLDATGGSSPPPAVPGAPMPPLPLLLVLGVLMFARKFQSA